MHFYGVGCILASISRLDYAAVDGVDTKQGTGEPFPVIAAEVVAVFVGEVIAAVEVPDRYQQPLFTGLTISHPGHLQGYPVYLVGGRGKVVAAAGYIVFHQHHFLEDLIDLMREFFAKRYELGLDSLMEFIIDKTGYIEYITAQDDAGNRKGKTCSA